MGLEIKIPQAYIDMIADEQERMYRQPGVKVGTLKEIMGSRVKIKFPHRFDFPSGITNRKLDAVKEWCETECKGYYNIHTAWACYVQFTEEKDALMFALRWGTGADEG